MKTETVPIHPPSPEVCGLKTSRECPSCHRQRAIVFYAVIDGKVRKDAQLVCLDCCPKARPDC
jgi:hypothetical protein